MLLELLSTDFEHSDDRGTLIQLVHEGFQQINVITSKANVMRGGHYHAKNQEAFFIITGSLELSLQLEDKLEVHRFGAGDFFLIKERIAHSFLFLDDCTLISLYSKGVELENGAKDIIVM